MGWYPPPGKGEKDVDNPCDILSTIAQHAESTHYVLTALMWLDLGLPCISENTVPPWNHPTWRGREVVTVP